MPLSGEHPDHSIPRDGAGATTAVLCADSSRFTISRNEIGRLERLFSTLRNLHLVGCKEAARKRMWEFLCINLSVTVMGAPLHSGDGAWRVPDATALKVELPIIATERFPQQVTNRERVRMSLKVFDRINSLNCVAEVSIRGSSSSMYPKKPYRVELQDSAGNDLKIPLCGMPAESDWVLYPSYMDKTFVRDVLMYDLWGAIGYYSTRWRFVEVYMRTNAELSALGDQLENCAARQEPCLIDSNSEYQGIYILLEKIKRGKDRVSIQKLHKKDNSEPEITGGYILKRDRLNNPGDRAFKSSRRLEFIFEEPKAREVTGSSNSFSVKWFLLVMSGLVFSFPW